MSLMLSLSPYASWMTTTPGCGPGAVGQREVAATLQLAAVDVTSSSWHRAMVAASRVGPRGGRYHLLLRASWARGAVGSASDWQSEGQGFESPRVHQIFEFKLVSCGVTTCGANTLTDTLTGSPAPPDCTEGSTRARGGRQDPEASPGSAPPPAHSGASISLRPEYARRRENLGGHVGSRRDRVQPMKARRHDRPVRHRVIAKLRCSLRDIRRRE